VSDADPDGVRVDAQVAEKGKKTTEGKKKATGTLARLKRLEQALEHSQRREEFLMRVIANPSILNGKPAGVVSYAHGRDRIEIALMQH